MNETLTQNQVWTLGQDLTLIFKLELEENYPEINKYEIQVFVNKVLEPRIRAILCTLNSVAYEDIIKSVREKLKINDLFDNRQQYLK